MNIGLSKGGEDYHREKLIYELLRVLRERDYKKIVTHGENGEYGHPRHRGCHDVLIPSGDLNYFGFSIEVRN